MAWWCVNVFSLSLVIACPSSRAFVPQEILFSFAVSGNSNKIKTPQGELQCVAYIYIIDAIEPHHQLLK